MWNLVMGSLVSSDYEEYDDDVASVMVEMANDISANNGSPQIDKSHNEISPTQFKRESSPTATCKPKLSDQSNISIQSDVSDVRVRQQGDGMEVTSTPKAQPEELSLRQIVASTGGDLSLPSSNGLLLLSKLPPILDKVELLPSIPTSPLVLEKPKLYPKGSYPAAAAAGRKTREPKFVPYEPYKGAVSHITDQPRKVSRRSSETKLNAASSSSTESETCVTNSSTTCEQDQSYDTSIDGTVNSAVPSPGSPADSEISSGLKDNFRAMLDIKEKELKQLRSALENSEKQLKIQSQVNSELKKLLVASVGEDIEARVDFLTQDKARLAADVLHYNNKISRDWEEKEALHVESDIWRSKFLASTVILEEVTREKSLSQSRCQQLEHVSRRILSERSEVKTSLRSMQQIVDKLNASFDPTWQRYVSTEPAHMLMQAAHLHKTCQALCDRLIGDKKMSFDDEPSNNYCEGFTQPEIELNQLLSNPSSSASIIPEQASSCLTKGAKTLLRKLGDEAQSPGKSAFNTCSHCNGSVHVV